MKNIKKTFSTSEQNDFLVVHIDPNELSDFLGHKCISLLETEKFRFLCVFQSVYSSVDSSLSTFLLIAESGQLLLLAQSNLHISLVAGSWPV